jgi:lipoprotein-anchoring transpeptidase ErfK/SrfK
MKDPSLQRGRSYAILATFRILAGEPMMPPLVQAACAAATVCAVSMAVADRALADIVVRVDKSAQRMSVMVDGVHRYTWPVSTGVGGTPSGSFRARLLSRYHRSSIYGNAPMPYAIFYDGNYAIHATTYVAQLGGPASRGCVRLHPSNAAVLFSLVQKQGLASTHIHVQ